MLQKINRVVLIVMDSVGIGALPDADQYGDTGSNTLLNTARAVGGVRLPHLAELGLCEVVAVPGTSKTQQLKGAYGKMAEKSRGKDTTTGHWELAGIISQDPFPTYPDGFPREIIEPFEQAIGRRTLGNKAASGTEIIAELGEEHMKTGYPIVYTSADSVFQIAAHEEVIPVEELYRICEIARTLLTGPHAVGRVIARPFAGTPGNFQRTPRRHDYSLKPPAKTILNFVADKGQEVVAIGKISDIFAGEGITRQVPSKSNQEGVDRTIEVLKEDFSGLVFTNLVDFDMLYGHRNDPQGYARALEAFDARIPEIVSALKPDDVLIITADHGCDPTTESTDHSREYVPVLISGKMVRGGVNLGVRETFADVAATIAELLDTERPAIGRSMVGDFLVKISPMS